MPVFDDRFAHRTWNATKVLLKQLTNVNRTDSLEPGGPSIFDLKEEQKNIQHILLDKQYEYAKTYRDSSGYKVDLEEITRSIKCLDSLKSYLDARENAIQTACTDKTFIATLKTNTATEDLNNKFQTLKKTIQKKEIESEEIGLFSLVNELIIIRNADNPNQSPKEILKQQLEADIKVIKNSQLDQAAQTKIIEALEKNHETNFKVFEDTMNAEITTELNRARFENSRLALVKLWQDKGSADMKKQLDDAIAESKKGDHDKVTLTATVEKPDKEARTDFQAAFGKIQKFKTLSGLEVTQSKPGSFQIQFPGRYNVFYHNDLQDNVAADLELLALHIKASGCTEITFTLNGSNTEDIHLIARKAYEAAIKQGFKGGKDGAIHFKVNGKVMNLFDELDKDNKTTKGVFSNEREMKQYEKEDVEQRMREKEKQDPKIKLIGSTAEPSKEIKAILTKEKEQDTAMEIRGAASTKGEEGSFELKGGRR